MKMNIDKPGTGDAVLRPDLLFGVDRRIPVPGGDPAVMIDMKFGGFISDRAENPALGGRCDDMSGFDGQFVFESFVNRQFIRLSR